MARLNINTILRIYLILILFVISKVYAVSILYDDLMDDLHFPGGGYRDAYDGSWDNIYDTLRAHGVNICFVSDSGYNNLENYEFIWIQSALTWMWHNPTELEQKIANYILNGGKLLVAPICDYSINLIENHLLNNDYMQSGIKIVYNPIFGDTCLWWHIDNFVFDSTSYLLSFLRPWEVLIEKNSYCILSVLNTCIASISFPFGRCIRGGGYIIVITGNHTWEIYNDCGEDETDTYAFARNILLGLADVPGYEFKFNPCDLIDTVNRCKSFPNPITPNFDAINDFAQFEFDGIFVKPALIHIFDIHGHEVRTIDVPAGLSAKQHARWDGTDDGGNPVPEGVYIYTIEVAGEVVCEGTVTVAP